MSTTVSRRTALQGLTGLAIAGALGPAFARAAAAAPTLSAADLTSLRKRWVDAITGRGLIAASPGTFRDALAKLDGAVASRLSKVSPGPTQFFSDRNWSTGSTPVQNSNAMRMNYVDLQQLAIAWATPGSEHFGSEAVLATVKDGLAHMHATVYNPETQWWGNWWSWIIGASKPLSDILAVIHDQLEQGTIDDYCAAIDHFVPNRDPRLQIHPSGVIVSVGANRVDICQALIVRSVVQPDTTLLQAAVAALSPTWQYVTEGNGFFEDGSFIQHSTIGYTGTYGLVLLGGLAKLFALLAGTAYDIDDPTRVNLTSAIEGSFAPLMFNGQMMDAVRGRAVSRIQERSIDDGNQLIESTLMLAQAADATTAARWRGLCRQWIDSNSDATITDTTNIVRLALVTDLMSSDVTPVDDVPGPRMFQAMDRLVYRGRENSWGLCVAMCSNRIAWHEGTPAENFEGVKTSQGMTYLYLPSDDAQFDDEFWATFDLTAPPGTTVDLTPLGPNPEGEWGANTPQNEWTGGATFEELAVAGMHLVAPGGTGLVARKTWFTTPDMVVALGSDLATASGNEVRTVVEHRNLGVDEPTLLVDGMPVHEPAAIGTPSWAHLEPVGGYVFLERPAHLSAEVAERQGTWRRNNTGTGPGTAELQRRQYATLAISHGIGDEVAGATYAYVLLPNSSIEATKAQAAKPAVSVLRNDGAAQAVRWTNVTAASFWRAATVGDFSSTSSMCLLARKVPGMVRLSVSDPTQAQTTLDVAVSDTAVTRVKGPDAGRVTLTRRGSTASLAVDVQGTAGATLEFSLHQ